MKKYVFKSYSEIFPILFDQEKAKIVSSLNHLLAIEHIGSTAVPNLGGKGIIDIAIAVAKEEMEATKEVLETLGYEFRPTYSTSDRYYFVGFRPDSEEGTRRYHIHLTHLENSEWKEFLGFRDYLRTHPTELQEYAQLKQKAALEADQDGEKYRKIKEPIFAKIKSYTT